MRPECGDDHNHHVLQRDTEAARERLQLLRDTEERLQFLRDDHNHHVLQWARGIHLREMETARARLQSLPSDRLERLVSCGFLDAQSGIAATEVIAERQRSKRGTH